MPACPWCKAATFDLLAPCPRCGRLADEEAAPAALSDVPDLDIPARPSKTGGEEAVPAKAVPPAKAAPAPSRQAGAQPAPPRSGRAVEADREESANNAFADPGARTFEAEDDALEGGSLDLDLSNGPPLVASTNASVPKVPQAPVAGAGAGAPGASGAAAGVGAPATAPAGGAQPAKAEVDRYEARALADYGEPPSAWWKAPLYAYRVLRRRPELKKIADQKRREAERAEGAAEDALLAFASLVRSDAEKLGAYGGAFESVRATERVLGDRDAVLASETEAHKHRQAEHDTKLAGLEAELSQIQAEERLIAGALAEADTLLKRAEARAKRLEIEMRNAIAQEQEAAAPQTAKGPGV